MPRLVRQWRESSPVARKLKLQTVPRRRSRLVVYPPLAKKHGEAALIDVAPGYRTAGGVRRVHGSTGDDELRRP